MSGYWQAVRRAALGLAGTAQPRPRALFEGGAGPDGPPGLDSIEEEREVSPPLGDAPVQPRLDRPVQPIPAVPAPGPASPAPAGDRAGPADREPIELLVREERGAAAGMPLEGGLEPERPVPTPRAEAPAPVVETRIVESIRETVVERVLVPQPAEERASSRPAEPTVQAETIPAEPRAGAETEPPPPSLLLVAEPAAPPTMEREEIPDRDETPPALVIEIGRIDIRLAPDAPSAPAPARREESRPVLSLEDYLSRQSGGAG